MIFMFLCRYFFKIKVFKKFFQEHYNFLYMEIKLTLCMLGILCFCCFSTAIFKINFSKNSFRYTIRVLNSLDPDQDRHSVGPDLGPNCLQRLSADNKS